MVLLPKKVIIIHFWRMKIYWDIVELHLLLA